MLSLGVPRGGRVPLGGCCDVSGTLRWVHVVMAWVAWGYPPRDPSTSPWGTCPPSPAHLLGGPSRLGGGMRGAVAALVQDSNAL